MVRQDLTPQELLGYILPSTGKDAARVREVLRQGMVVRGASRFRWAPLELEAAEVAAALVAFPDPRPDRPFEAAQCVRAKLTGGRAAIDLERKAASRKRWFKRRSFWPALLEIAARLPLKYQHYSYADRTDIYAAELSADAASELRAQSRLLPYATLERVVREYGYTRLELWVER